MLKSGLVSVTFRDLNIKEIVDLVVEAKLDGIEWGGDIHVPQGDIATAKEAYKISNDAGLTTDSYGSYYYVHESHKEGIEFERIIETAIELHSKTIRIWAGKKSSAEANSDYINYLIKDSIRIANLAQKSDIKIAYEHHTGTLTDTNGSTSNFLKSINHPNILSYWQPYTHTQLEYNQNGLSQAIGHKLANIHVFNWSLNNKREIIRQPLSKAKNEWLSYFKIAMTIPGEHYAMLEFVENDLPENFIKDARVLKEMLLSI